jgi:PAS domain S-box-containing protein
MSRTIPSSIASTASFSEAVAWRSALVACLFVVTIVLLSAGKIRDWIVEDAAREEILVARLAAQQIDQTIRTAKVILDGAAIRLEENMPLLEGARRAVEEMSPRLAHDTQFVGLKVLDASGIRLLASSAVGDSAWSSQEPPDFFTGAARSPGPFHIGYVQESTINRRPVMTIGRRVADPDGRLIAVIGLSIDLARLREIAEDTLSLRDRTLVTIRADGTALFRLPDPGPGAQIAGVDLSDRPAYRRVVEGEMTGHYKARSPVDGIVRVGGFVLSPDRDIVVLSARAERDILLQALFSRGLIVLWLLGSALVVAGFGAYAAAELRRRKALIAGRDELLRSLDVADAGVAITDGETQVVRYVNSAFERITGYTAVEMTGRSFQVLQGQSTDPVAAAKIREAIVSGRPVRVDILNHRKNSEPFWSDLSIAPVLDADGKVTGFVSSFHDISDRVHMTERLNEALLRTRAADQAKSIFLARMSHELRTPLNAIIGFADAMSARVLGPLSDRYVGYARDIHDSGAHLLSLIERILEMARLGNDARPIDSVAVDLADVARAAAVLASSEIDSAGANLRVASHGPAIALGDATALRQIAVNLLVNAARHGQKNGNIELRTGPGPDGTVHLTVCDDGPGLPLEVLSSAGTPFLGRSSDIADGAGLGLGIAISTELAARMGGRLSFTNTSPGACVTLHVPAANGSRAAA